MKKLLLTAAALSLLVFPAYATKGIRENSQQEIARSRKNGINRVRRDGIVRVKSNYSVEETVKRFEIGRAHV